MYPQTWESIGTDGSFLNGKTPCSPSKLTRFPFNVRLCMHLYQMHYQEYLRAAFDVHARQVILFKIVWKCTLSWFLIQTKSKYYKSFEKKNLLIYVGLTYLIPAGVSRKTCFVLVEVEEPPVPLASWSHLNIDIIIILHDKLFTH